jgi:hypothetical protein
LRQVQGFSFLVFHFWLSSFSCSFSMRWFVAVDLSFLLSTVTADVCGPREGLSACLDDWYGREAYSSHFSTSIHDYYNASLTGISRCKETFALSRCEKGGVFDLQVERPWEDRPCATSLTCGGAAECTAGALICPKHTIWRESVRCELHGTCVCSFATTLTLTNSNPNLNPNPNPDTNLSPNPNPKPNPYPDPNSLTGKRNCNDTLVCSELLEVHDLLLEGGHNIIFRHGKTTWQELPMETAEPGSCHFEGIPSLHVMLSGANSSYLRCLVFSST